VDVVLAEAGAVQAHLVAVANSARRSCYEISLAAPRND
jgi:hypothetical protein